MHISILICFPQKMILIGTWCTHGHTTSAPKKVNREFYPSAEIFKVTQWVNDLLKSSTIIYIESIYVSLPYI